MSEFTEALERQQARHFAKQAADMIEVFQEAASDAVRNGGELIANIDALRDALKARVSVLAPGIEGSTTETSKGRAGHGQGDPAQAVEQLTKRLMESSGASWERAYPAAYDIVLYEKHSLDVSR